MFFILPAEKMEGGGLFYLPSPKIKDAIFFFGPGKTKNLPSSKDPSPLHLRIDLRTDIRDQKAKMQGFFVLRSRGSKAEDWEFFVLRGRKSKMGGYSIFENEDRSWWNYSKIGGHSGQQPGTKSARGPADQPLISRGSTAGQPRVNR